MWGKKSPRVDEPKVSEGKSEKFQFLINSLDKSSKDSFNDEKDEEEERNFIRSSSDPAMVKPLL